MAESDEARKEATEMQAEEARVGFAEILGRVSYSGERIVITRYGKPVAALVPMSDYEKMSAA